MSTGARLTGKAGHLPQIGVRRPLNESIYKALRSLGKTMCFTNSMDGLVRNSRVGTTSVYADAGGPEQKQIAKRTRG